MNSYHPRLTEIVATVSDQGSLVRCQLAHTTHIQSAVKSTRRLDWLQFNTENQLVKGSYSSGTLKACI